MKKSKFLALLTAISMILTTILCFVGCGGTKGTTNSKLVINGSYGEGFVDGVNDEVVRKTIEEKFKKDTGKDLELEVNTYTEAAFNQGLSGWFAGGADQVDGVKKYVVNGGSNIINYARTPDVAVPLGHLIEGSVYQKSINKNDENHIVERAGYMNVDGEMTYNVLVDCNNEKGWGWAVNKTFWKWAYDTHKTTLNPEDYDASNENYKNLKISEFEEVMLAIKDVCGEKQETEGIAMKYPVWAYGWDMERLFAPLFDVSTLNTVKIQRKGKDYYVRSFLCDGYSKYLDWLTHLINRGIYESANTSTTDHTRHDYFCSGSSAVYMSFPDIELLMRICEDFKVVNKDKGWECMICGPLAREDGIVPGFAKREKAGNGIVVPWHSENAQLLVDYLNWMYSDKENYELCLYGRQGIDWVPEQIDVFGTTYDGWKYPDDKVDEYKHKIPYSGKYAILLNVNVSDRIDLSYSEKEVKYFVRSKYAKDNKGFQYYYDANWKEGLYVAEVPDDLSSGEMTVKSGFEKGPQAQAWSGKCPKQFNDFNEYYSAWREQLFKDDSNSKKYIDWYDNQIRTSLDFFEKKWGKA